MLKKYLLVSLIIALISAGSASAQSQQSAVLSCNHDETLDSFRGLDDNARLDLKL